METSEVPDVLALHAAGFVVRTDGRWTGSSVARFRRFLQARGVQPSTELLAHALREAKERHFEGAHGLYVCAASPCSDLSGFDTSDEALRRCAERIDVPITKTGCQGHCKRAPFMALRILDRTQMFGGVVAEEDRDAILDYAKVAASAQSFVVAGAADRYRVDTAHHHHEEPAAQLAPVAFLLGRFRGEGRFERNGYTFQKESFGSYEAGGRVLALRMEASYPLPEGGDDVHRALVIVASDPRSASLTGRVYTDGGSVRDHAVERHDHAIEFDDVSPDHAQRWTRVRKTLRQTSEGYDEHLYVDDGRGLVPYCSVRMRHVA